jgi:hypothetical protein
MLIVGVLSLGGVIWNNAHAANTVDAVEKGGKDGGSIELAGKDGGSIELAGKDGGSIELANAKEGGGWSQMSAKDDGGK